MNASRHALALFSGGLDSILASKLMQEQGFEVTCLHFTSPFFGHPDKVARWQKVYDLNIQVLDVGQEYVDMMRAGPSFGFGKVLNPCVDCKILMLRRARALLEPLKASFIISGEVLGQRPMSQRRDALNAIRRDAEVKELLLRPLCALRLDPTPMEESGQVDRERLLGIAGRGRKQQMELAKRYGLKEIPTPAGGCRLAEVDAAARYAQIFLHAPDPTADDFHLANVGRQYWNAGHWLAIGRNQADNTRMEKLTKDRDLVFKVQNFPGPLCLGRQFPDRPWSPEIVKEAAAFMASFSPKAKKSQGPVDVRVTCGSETGVVTVRIPDRKDTNWQEPAGMEAIETWRPR